MKSPTSSDAFRLELPDGPDPSPRSAPFSPDVVLDSCAAYLPRVLAQEEFWTRRRASRCRAEFDLTRPELVRASELGRLLEDLFEGISRPYAVPQRVSEFVVAERPPGTMTYTETVQFLYELRLFGLKLGLENTRQLAALVGNPQERLRFIHVAGTNGKGSTCAMLESVYRTAGFKVGLFTSPHLVSFRERIQVNRQWIAEADVVRLVGRLRPLIEAFPADHHPTFFEAVTVLALLYFAEQQCDLVIWETGMGGRLDATNLVTPLASLITNIQFDHQKWLGNTRIQIAAEKAGIIKPGVPVLTTTDETDALEVITRTANAANAPLTVLSPVEACRTWPSDVGLSLLGDHQKANAALAWATVRSLANVLPVSEGIVREGLAGVRWPGRLQSVALPNGKTVLLDGAHNPAGAEALAAAIRQHFADCRPTLILGILQDKDWPAMCTTLASLADRVLLVPVKSERSAAPEVLRQECYRVNPRALESVCGSLAEAVEAAREDPFLVITGSLYLVGEALELLHLSAVNGCGEGGLNEWSAGKSL